MSIERVSAATLMRQRLFRCWIERLSLAEFVVCCFIYERTYPFNKPDETIPVRHFLEGIDGRGFRPGGIPIGRTQLMAVLKSLDEKRAIYRCRARGIRTIYGLNPLWPEDPIEWDENYPQSAVDNSKSQDASRSQMRTTDVRRREYRTSEPNSRNELMIVDGRQPTAAVPPHQQQKGEVSHSRKASHGRVQSSRRAS